MECGECNIRSSVGFCHECDILLCEVCTHVCERCKKVVCKSHIQRTSSGRRICVSCVVHHYDKRAKKAKERRELRAEAAVTVDKSRKRSKKKKKAPPSAPSGDNLSFESLNEGGGDFSGGPAPIADEPAPYSPLVDEEAINDRVLTGSGRERSPAWVTGLALSAVAWFLCLASFGGSSLGMQQYLLSILAVIVAAGASIWTGSGSFAKGDKQLRIRCRIAFFVGLSALAFSGLVLYIRMIRGA
jgi:hypothetical protein